MKVYKVYFSNDPNTYIPLNEGYLCFPSYKKKQYDTRNEFNNQFKKSPISPKKPCVHTFSEYETEKSLFFFLDLFDAIKYISYSSSKYGNFNSILPEYKILELEVPNELILKHLGIGNYEFEREYTYHLALEVAIPFDELQKLMKGALNHNKEMIPLESAKIYDASDPLIVKIVEFLRTNPNYKSQDYMNHTEQMLQILGFKMILGSIYKNPISGKLKFMLDNPQYKSFVLNEILTKISNEIDENMSKYNIRSK